MIKSTLTCIKAKKSLSFSLTHSLCGRKKAKRKGEKRFLWLKKPTTRHFTIIEVWRLKQIVARNYRESMDEKWYNFSTSFPHDWCTSNRKRRKWNKKNCKGDEKKFFLHHSTTEILIILFFSFHQLILWINIHAFFAPHPTSHSCEIFVNISIRKMVNQNGETICHYVKNYFSFFLFILLPSSSSNRHIEICFISFILFSWTLNATQHHQQQQRERERLTKESVRNWRNNVAIYGKKEEKKGTSNWGNNNWWVI